MIGSRSGKLNFVRSLQKDKNTKNHENN